VILESGNFFRGKVYPKKMEKTVWVSGEAYCLEKQRSFNKI
jgi:ribosomal protein S17